MVLNYLRCFGCRFVL